MAGIDCRFNFPETAEEQDALVRARVRERVAGMRLVAAVAAAAGLAAAVTALGSRLGAEGARQLLAPALAVAVMTVVALAVVTASSMMWRLRLRRCNDAVEPEGSAPPDFAQVLRAGLIARRPSFDRDRIGAPARRFSRVVHGDRVRGTVSETTARNLQTGTSRESTQ